MNRIKVKLIYFCYECWLNNINELPLQNGCYHKLESWVTNKLTKRLGWPSGLWRQTQTLVFERGRGKHYRCIKLSKIQANFCLKVGVQRRCEDCQMPLSHYIFSEQKLLQIWSFTKFLLNYQPWLILKKQHQVLLCEIEFLQIGT